MAAPTKSRYDREPASPSRSVTSRVTGRKRLRLAFVPAPWGSPDLMRALADLPGGRVQ
jgi:hypothetical protein